MTIDLANSIYIDWGAFVSAVINFFLIAFVLFTIVKIMNRIRENNQEIKEKIQKRRLSKEIKIELKEKGINRSDKKAVEEYFAQKKLEEEKKKEAEKLAAEEEAKQKRLANPTTEDLLKKLIENCWEKIEKTKKQPNFGCFLFIFFHIYVIMLYT